MDIYDYSAICNRLQLIMISDYDCLIYDLPLNTIYVFINEQTNYVCNVDSSHLTQNIYSDAIVKVDKTIRSNILLPVSHTAKKLHMYPTLS